MSLRTATHAIVRPEQIPQPAVGSVIQVAWVFGPTAVSGPRMFVRTDAGWVPSLDADDLANPITWEDLVTIPMAEPAGQPRAREVLITTFID